MATVRSLPRPLLDLDNGYPTSDGRPMAETDWHRDLMMSLIMTLQWFNSRNPLVYVSGNLLMFYERGNRRRHVSPDVFVVKGVPKHPRPNYLLWKERRSPQVAIELTSSSTRHEDLETKFHIYQDKLKIREYFLFDPRCDYLDPPLLGYRLRRGKYHPIDATTDGRIPSQTLGLHLERSDRQLRLWNPATEQWLPTPMERAEQAELLQVQAELVDAYRQRSHNAEAEIARLRAENEQLRKRNGL